MQLLCEHFPGAALSLYGENNGCSLPQPENALLIFYLPLSANFLTSHPHYTLYNSQENTK
jgi:hypothetical protein